MKVLLYLDFRIQWFESIHKPHLTLVRRIAGEGSDRSHKISKKIILLG